MDRKGVPRKGARALRRASRAYRANRVHHARRREGAVAWGPRSGKGAGSQEQERAEEVQRDAEQFVREREEAQEEARRLREELEAERSKGFWRRLFGG